MSRTGIGSTKKMLSSLVEMSEKRSIGIFPEGTRTLTGELNEFYRGFIMLMRNSEMDLLPVTLNGFYELKPKNRFHISFHSRLKVVIHEPIKNKEISDKSDLQIISTVKGIIESGLLRSDSNQEHTRINEKYQ
jgi:1-acyl-sn-glycerol-3-phosphate acyltransferase